MTNGRSRGGFARAAAIGWLALAAAACQGNSTPPPADTAAPPVDPAVAAREKLIARGKSLVLPTPYEPPPGDALSHNTSGYAKTVCSAVYLTCYDPEYAA
ncbi:MAG: hypothetical protein AB7O93_24005, partial [Vicinamibacterales bacterium]